MIQVLRTMGRSIQNTLYLLGLVMVVFYSNLAWAQNITTNNQRVISKFGDVRTAVNNNTVTIVLGVDSDTQIHVARDMMEVLNTREEAGSNQLRVLPMMSDGGEQNALDIMFLRGVDLGIMQTDILAHLRGKKRSLYKDIFTRIHYVTKLYNAEWHVIGRKNITNIRQLKGKKVNISKPGSGSYITSRNIFELLGIRVNYTSYDNALALEMLRKGELDAVVWMGGAPLKQVQSISLKEGLHIIPATFFFESYNTTPLRNVLEQFYLPTHLSHEQYPNLIEPGQRVPTVANGVVLAAYNWSLSKNLARRKKVENFVQKFISKFKSFKAEGRHPKWREVNLLATIPEWRRSNLAKRFLANLESSGGFSREDRRVKFSLFLEFLRQSGDQDFSRLSDKEKYNLYQRFLDYSQKN